MRALRIATRGSDLALAQATTIAERVRNELQREAELVVLTTTGDRIQDVSLSKVGGKGLFVKEIEEALLDGRADVAVHSAKDLPVSLAPGLELAAFPEREDPLDALVCREVGASLSSLREGARVGTGSVRRTAQLLAHRRDLEIVPLRGNVPTRLAKLESEDLDAVVLAAAGLRRLGLAGRISECVSAEVMLPAVCQGILALEVREGEGKLVGELSSPQVEGVARAERAFQARLGGDCTVPLACFAEPLSGARLRLRGLLASLDGKRICAAEASAPVAEAERLGSSVAEALFERGAAEILAALREETGA